MKKNHKKVVLVDNYDSFTYNLSQSLQVLGAEVCVFRNDAVSVEEVEAMSFTHLVISPGPGLPANSGMVPRLIPRLAGRAPVLGVCLGHQALGEAFGARLVRAPRPVHGKTSRIEHDGRTIFHGLDNPFTATRYHSLLLERESVPDCLEVTACSEDGLVMGIRHATLPIEGVQFHPESILTPQGDLLMRNFLEMEVV
jgi:anthranilate synthase/aminodeoxychorismate synthase-like glutamine amidotransferase